MKRNMKVIQINGFRGVALGLFVVSCLIAGFVAFPAFLSMCLWNALAAKVYSIPSLSFFGGLLLWGIIALSFIIFNKKKFLISFNTPHELSEDEIKNVLSKIKNTDFSNISKDLNEKTEIVNDEIKEISTNSKEN